MGVEEGNLRSTNQVVSGAAVSGQVRERARALSLFVCVRTRVRI
jgi:hypothetical protein